MHTPYSLSQCPTWKKKNRNNRCHATNNNTQPRLKHWGRHKALVQPKCFENCSERANNAYYAAKRLVAPALSCLSPHPSSGTPRTHTQKRIAHWTNADKSKKESFIIYDTTATPRTRTTPHRHSINPLFIVYYTISKYVWSYYLHQMRLSQKWLGDFQSTCRRAPHAVSAYAIRAAHISLVTHKLSTESSVRPILTHSRFGSLVL